MKKLKDSHVHIFTDGACSGNPGPGGWGAVVSYSDTDDELFGFSEYTTNNRMELLAAIRALESLTEEYTVYVTTDSRYVKDGITKWIHSWKKKGWKTSKKKPVENKDLWERLEAVAAKHAVTWYWVKGHAGHEENELADSLATAAVKKGKRGEIDSDTIGELWETLY